MKKLDVRDVLGEKGIGIWMLNLLGEGRSKQWFRLTLFAILPLAALSAATIYEGRFQLGSVTMLMPEMGAVLGMSFLGDTMVWPFCLLVPLLFKLVSAAAQFTATTINRLSAQIADNLQSKERPKNYGSVVDRTQEIFRGKVGLIGWMARTMPFVIALTFWGYNTATCVFYPELGEQFYPYKSVNVVVMSKLNTSDQSLKQYRLEKPIALPKWDCDRVQAPWSTWLTRVWTLVFYGLPPFLLFRLMLMILGLSYFLRHFRLWSQERKINGDQRELLVKPFATDGFGGLGFIANTGMAFFYASFIFVLLVLMSYLKEGAAPSWHNYLLIVVLVPMSIYTFFAPAIVIRNTIKDAKERYLDFLSHHSNKLFGEVLDCTDESAFEYRKYDHKISVLKVFYDQVHSMAVWPFSVSTVLKIVLTVTSPIAAVVLQAIVSSYIK